MNEKFVDRLISRKELRARFNISISTEWRRLQNDLLPKPFVINGRILGYLLSSFNKWIDDNS